jgi:predicted RNase H-like HicB family nuclease
MVIYWSEDDDAIKNTLTVIQEWIDTAIELGREIPIPKGRLIYA